MAIPLMKNNYISFSLWGDKALYTIGAIRNAELAKSIYNGWKVIVFFDDTVPAAVLEELKSLGVILKDMSQSQLYGMFWRFYAAELPDADHVIFRDLDSRLSMRERLAVNEWIKNGDLLHVMRDHPAHQVPFGASGMSMLGGMWGIKAGKIKLADRIEQFCNNKEGNYGLDQTFLEDLYLEYKSSMTVHDDFFAKKPFPSKRSKYRFIGERIDENESPVGDDWKQILSYDREHHPSLLRRIKRSIQNVLR